MERTFTAIFQESEGWIVGYVEELPGANVQERTIEEARASMKEVIRELLDVNRELHAKAQGTASVIREELTVTL
jgi:predicted RNase H-like HicB family nuclease